MVNTNYTNIYYKIIFLTLSLCFHVSTAKTHTLLHKIFYEKEEKIKKIERSVRIPVLTNYISLTNEEYCHDLWPKFFDSHTKALYVIAKHYGYVDDCVPYDMEDVERELEGGERKYEALREGKFDIDFMTTDLRLTGNVNVSFLYPHDIQNICMLVPKMPRTRSSMLSTVPYLVWVTIALCTSILYAVDICVYEVDRAFVFIEVIRALVTGCFDTHLRTFMFWMSVLSFFLSNTIAGSFTGSVVTPGRNKEINTIEEVLTHFDHIFAESWDMPRIHPLRKAGGDLSRLADKIEFVSFLIGGDVYEDLPSTAIVSDPDTLAFVKQHINATDHGYSIFRPFPECLINTGYLSFAVQKEWLHADRFSGLLQRLVEGGLMFKLKAEKLEGLLYVGDYRRMGLVSGAVQDGDPPTSVQPVSLPALREAVVLWGVGLGAATLGFLAELCLARSRALRERFFQSLRSFRTIEVECCPSCCCCYKCECCV